MTEAHRWWRLAAHSRDLRVAADVPETDWRPVGGVWISLEGQIVIRLTPDEAWALSGALGEASGWLEQQLDDRWPLEDGSSS
jgi:hypothetical protein